MRPADQLAEFSRQALMEGRSRQEINTALQEAGWAKSEISQALDAWSDSDFTPPVPRPRAYVSARDAFIYALMFSALVMTAWHLAALSFNLIDRWIPDLADNSNRLRWSLRKMRFSIAALVVFAPLFMFINMRIMRAARDNSAKRRSGVRKLFVYITLFLASITLLGDLLWLIYSLLQGDLNIRFISKVLVVAAIGGAIFAYFRPDTDDDSHA